VGALFWEKLYWIVDMKTFKISVSEPWDFEGPDGPNLIEGMVDEQIAQAADYLIVLRTRTLAFQSVNYSAIALSRRYQNEPDRTGLLLGETVYVNGEFGQVGNGVFCGSGRHQIVGSCQLVPSEK
jgi:hypothetical protein